MKHLLAAALLLAFAPLAHTVDEVRYVALINGGKDKAGHLVVNRIGERYAADYLFKDNGRGPELKETYELAPDGTFARYEVKGTSTFGALVNETFARHGNTARWKTTSDAGDQLVEGTAHYEPLGGTPQTLSVALAALAKRSDGKLPMIPSGTLTSRTLAEMDVAHGAEQRKVQLLALTGLGFTPTVVWASANRMFALIFPGTFQLIEEGWETNAAALEARQIAAEQEMLVELEQRLSRPLDGSTLIRNARVFDSERATLLDASDVLIDAGRIIEVSPAGTSKRKATRVIDAANRVLLPGLFDMHVHVGFWDGALYLGTGITTIRDLGGDNPTTLEMIEQEAVGTLLMPRLVAAGFIEGESPYAARSGFVIQSLEEAQRAIDWYHDHGFPQIKVYNSFPREILADVTAYAHAKGMRVSGHVPVHLRAEDVVLAGYDEIQHINQVLLNFLVDEETDTRTLERFYLPANRVADLDFDSPEVQRFIKLLAQRKVVVDPTLATFNFIRQQDGVLSQTFAAVADHMPPSVRRGFLAGAMNIPDAQTHARFERSYAKMIDFVGRLYRAGVPIVAGTDDLPGFTLQRELELYVEAGLTPLEVLQIATYNGAKYARVLDDRGVISPGRRADLILTDGDPTTNISDIRKVALVIKGDVAYYPSEVLAAMGVTPFTAPLTIE